MSQNSAGQSSNKGKGKNKKWKNNKSEDAKKTTPSSNQQGKSSSNSNKKGETNKEKKKCGYCKKLGHEEHECYHKNIDELMTIMKKHNVPLPNTYKEFHIQREKGKHSWQIRILQRNGFLTQVPPITWVLHKRIFLH